MARREQHQAIMAFFTAGKFTLGEKTSVHSKHTTSAKNAVSQNAWKRSTDKSTYDKIKVIHYNQKKSFGGFFGKIFVFLPLFKTGTNQRALLPENNTLWTAKRCLQFFWHSIRVVSRRPRTRLQDRGGGGKGGDIATKWTSPM